MSASFSIQGERQQTEGAGDEVEAEEHDEDEADGENERANERLPGLHRSGDGKARRRGEDAAG